MNFLKPNYSLLMDPFSLFFLAVIILISLPAALYSVGYMKSEYEPKKIFTGWLLLAAFILSMAAVVTAGNAFVFLVFWEIMSLVSYFLVVFDSGSKKAVNAGALYIIMTHIGTAFLIAAFILMYRHAGSFDLSAFKNAAPLMSSEERSLVFIFLFIGFGTKAGLVPLHLWLPYAHPLAPSHVSSLMSGVMIKVAVYGFARFVFFVLGVTSPWWGQTVMFFAALSCLVGIMYALTEHDLKRLLAYSSIENNGIIFLGVGASMVFMSLRQPVLAALALSAGLFHLLNHAVFKSLLFMCAGSVIKATHQRDMEKMGGLIKLMPWTAAFFLAGALAISAIPPFNGFASEWLLFQSFFAGALQGATAGTRIAMGVYASVLALTGGLAAACFVKAFGITFLAMPRSEEAGKAKEVPVSMLVSTGFLAVLSLALGLGAPAALKIISKIAASAAGAHDIIITAVGFKSSSLMIVPLGSIFAPLMVLFALTTAAGLAALAVNAFRGKRKVTSGLTWDCGYYELDSRTEYTSTAFSKPFRVAFSFFLRPYRKTEQIKESHYHIRSYRYELHNTYIFKRYLYEAGLQLTLRAARLLRNLQAGSIHVYIAYIFITLLALMIFSGK